ARRVCEHSEHYSFRGQGDDQRGRAVGANGPAQTAYLPASTDFRQGSSRWRETPVTVHGVSPCLDEAPALLVVGRCTAEYKMEVVGGRSAPTIHAVSPRGPGRRRPGSFLTTVQSQPYRDRPVVAAVPALSFTRAQTVMSFAKQAVVVGGQSRLRGQAG